MVLQMRSLAAIAASTATEPPLSMRRLSRVASLAHAWLWSPVSACMAAWRGTDAGALATMVTAIQHARSPREVAAALMVQVPAAIDSPVVAMLQPQAEAWEPLAGVAPVLPPSSAIASLLASPSPAIRVDETASLYRLLPRADRDWLARAGVAMLVPIGSSRGEALAGLLVGPRGGGRRHTRRDCACLSAAASTAALALESLRRRSDAAPDPQGESDDLAYECEGCGTIVDIAGACPCGGGRRLAALPARLRGSFEVQRRIGRGGMGVVYLGRDTRLDRAVALKTLPSLSPGLVDAMLAEARAMAAVEHPQVAAIYGLEEWRGTPVLVVEYLPGGTLASRLADGPLGVPDALSLGVSIADTLGALHEHGWLHRDIKPSNIGFGRGGLPKLLDFGLTRWLRDTHGACDDEDAVAGTPLYLSPDALDGHAAGEHDDVWALAVTLVEVITGQHPFEAPTRAGVCERVRSFAAGACATGPGMPDALAGVLERALRPHRSERIASARHLAAALRAVAPVT